MHDHLFYTAAGGRAGADVVHRAASVSGERRHDDPHDRRPRRRTPRSTPRQPSTPVACRVLASISPRRTSPAATRAPRAAWRRSRFARSGASIRRVLGAGRHDVDQGVHRHPPRGPRGGDRRGAQARDEGDRPSLLGELPGGGGARASTTSSTACSPTRISPGKPPDVCPPNSMAARRRWRHDGATAQSVIQTMVVEGRRR